MLELTVILAIIEKALKIKRINPTGKNIMSELIQVDDELLPAEPKRRKKHVRPYANDEAYIKEFIKNPHLGKKHAYQTVTGDPTRYSKQRANELHARLAPQINELLKERVLGCINFGMNRLFDLAENADSQGVQAAASSKLIELGLKCSPPNVTQREDRSREQILEEIKATRQRLTDMGTPV